VSGTIDIDPVSTALLVVDVQPDFCPGGNLEVPGGDEILDPLNELMRFDLFDTVVATQDWHPEGHLSFASTHAGREPMEVVELHGHDQILWPDHCIQGTPGAELHPGVDWARASVIVRKGMRPDADSYSGFRNNWSPEGGRHSTGLAGYLRERKVDTVYVCGLARDVCVRWTAEDARSEGFTTSVIWDLTRSVQPQEDVTLRARLEDQGVRIVDASRLRA